MILKSMMASATILLFGLGAMQYGCTSTPQKSEEDLLVEKMSPEERKRYEELKKEVEVGRNMAGRLLAHYGNQDNEQLLAYVNQVGKYVAGYSDFPERRYMIEVLSDDAVNAFACPGGYILVTEGAIRHAKNEAELAMVLGHEIAHVGRKHMMSTLDRMSDEEKEKEAKKAEEEKKKSALPDTVTVRKRPTPEKIENFDVLARYLGGQAAALGILRAARAGMSLILDKGLDQSLEAEADREGVKYAIRAGYDPKAMNNFLARLAKKKSKKKGPKTVLEKTHPSPRNRIKALKKVLAKLNSDEIVGAKGTKRFLKHQKLLPKKS